MYLLRLILTRGDPFLSDPNISPTHAGKIQHAPRSLVYPRSNRVRRALSSLLPPPPPESPDDNNGEEEDKRLRAEYAVLARAADVSVRSFSAVAAASEEKCDGDDDGDNGVVAQQQEHDHEQRHRHRQRQRRLCKSIVETDRCLRAAERGYATRLMLLTPRECTPKNDLLFGWPAEWGGGEEEEEGGVVVPLLEGGGALGAAEAAAFDAWFGGVGGDWEDGHGRGEEEGSGVVESH